MFSSRRFLYRMFYAILGCVTLTTALNGEEINPYMVVFSRPHGKIQSIVSPFSWLNVEAVQGIDLFMEICKAVDSQKSICLMVDPGAFSFSQLELEWIWKHFYVLATSKKDIKSLISFDEKEEDATLIPSVCLMSMELSIKGDAIRIISEEHFSQKEVHELYSKSLFAEEMRLFLRGGPLPSVCSPVPLNDLPETKKD